MTMNEQELDGVDEASLESFPASDPPAFTPLHAGMPFHEAKAVEPPPLDWRLVALVIACFGVGIFGGWAITRWRRA